VSAFVQLLAPAEAGPHNPTWHALRRQGITASEIAAVLGISPWESPFSLYWRKVNDWGTDDNPEMSAGRRAERVIADWYTERADPNESDLIHVVPAGLYRSTTRPWQMATPDRLICPPCSVCADLSEVESWVCMACSGTGIDRYRPMALLECKYLVAGWDGWGDEHTDEVPVHYRAQALWQADTLGVDEVHIAAWHGADLRIYVIRIADDEARADLHVMRDAGREFLLRIHDGEPPDIDQHAATLRTLKALHPTIDDRDQEIPAAIAAGYLLAHAAKAAAQSELDLWEARLRAAMGDARRAVCAGQTIATRSIFDRAAHEVSAGTVDRLTAARGPK